MIKFLLKKQWHVIVIWILCMPFLWWLVQHTKNPATNTPDWWSEADPIVTLTTLAIAFWLWVLEHHAKMLDSLPKKLTVALVHDGWVVLLCRDAYLASEADIRTWGQQIGWQMNDGKNVHFEPYIRQQDMGVVKDKNDQQFRAYRVQFTLRLDKPVPTNSGGPNHSYLLWEENPDQPGLVADRACVRENLSAKDFWNEPV